jgi:hypothetical protein
MSLHGPSLDFSLVFKRIGSTVVDGAIEIGGGLLGSYFGVMVAALLIAAQNEPPEQLQSSMYSGMGFGFVFWALAISFINRVLIQGLSRASIGKKVFKLELISSGGPLTWTTIMTRWILSYVSIAAAGLGYAYLFFNKEARAFHDVVAHTDIVPEYETAAVSFEYQEAETAAIQIASMQGLARVIVLPNLQAERPMATIIRLPVRVAIDAAIALGAGTAPVMVYEAEVIELRPVGEKRDEKKAA